MPVGNNAPPVNDFEKVKSLAFPYQLGLLGFPAMADPAKIYFYHILALLLTGKNEIVMNTAFGVNLHDYVFVDMTPIKQAQIASAVTTSIETYIPEVEVVSVLPEVSKNDEGLESTLLINITYRVAGQQITQQIPISPTMQGL